MTIMHNYIKYCNSLNKKRVCCSMPSSLKKDFKFSAIPHFTPEFQAHSYIAKLKGLNHTVG